MGLGIIDIPTRPTRADDATVAVKSKKKKTATTTKSGGGLLDRIEKMRQAVEGALGQYKDEYQIINDESTLVDYIQSCIDNKYISIDTETTGLNPLVDIIAGISINTRGKKSSYIPLNHISYITEEKSEGQLPIPFVAEQFRKLFDSKVDVDMFNAAFDIRVLRQINIRNAYCTWDASIACNILNDNEQWKNLKDLHNKYCLNGGGDAFRFDSLFRGIPFTKVPYKIGYVYAAHDTDITTQLCDFQRLHLRADSDREDIRAMYKVFKDIEMPIVNVVCDMEDAGIEFDFDKNEEFKVKYHGLLDEREEKFHKACEPYRDQIDAYRRVNGVFDNPINIKSTKQLIALMYDIMGLEILDKRSKKPSTKDEVLQDFRDNPVVKALIDYREFSTIVSTFIDKLPECVHTDGRIHCKFNQYGAKTGRFSSNDPNMQNIPSHNKEIRQMFKAKDGYVLMSSDFSQQEPKCLAALCRQQGDAQMYDTFMQGKDLYSEIASKSFNKPYEECKEFNPDGSTNKEGKERRTQAKSILLGVLYGRGTESIGEQLGCTKEKAEAIKNSVFVGFPAIKQFEQDSLDMAKRLGYVTTVCGRKRRLPELQLDEFEFDWIDGKCPYFDPLDFESNEQIPVPFDRVDYYTTKLKKGRFRDKPKVIEEAKNEGIKIIDNGVKIADATRQCVNARIQGSAADLTKLAMIGLNTNERLKELGFRVLVPVHDEVIAECPREHAKECSELLASIMSSAAEKILEMPIKCDVEVTERWYGEKVAI